MFARYLFPYILFALVLQLEKSKPPFKEKNSQSSLFNPYDDTFENKLNCVSARLTPSNVVLTSLVSLNISATFKTLSATLPTGVSSIN